MKEQYKNLPLRSGVGIVVLNQKNKIFVAKRIDNPKNFWQMPQGGIDEGEDFLSAAYRELKEETGIKTVSIDNSWESRTEYTFRKKGRKTTKQVYWYIASTDEVEVNLSEEHTSYLWLDYNDAETMLTFEQEKRLLRSAINHMEKSGTIP